MGGYPDLYNHFGKIRRMKVKAPPYSDIQISFDGDEDLPRMDERERTELLKAWSKGWPAYRQVLLGLFSEYEYEDLLKGKSRVAVQKLTPNKKNNDGANLLLRFSFDDTGITWDIFQKGRTIVHAQPAF
jgi:hypothetical protein